MLLLWLCFMLNKDSRDVIVSCIDQSAVTISSLLLAWELWTVVYELSLDYPLKICHRPAVYRYSIIIDLKSDHIATLRRSCRVCFRATYGNCECEWSVLIWLWNPPRRRCVLSLAATLTTATAYCMTSAGEAALSPERSSACRINDLGRGSTTTSHKCCVNFTG